jgi:hypothetical protein
MLTSSKRPVRSASLVLGGGLGGGVDPEDTTRFTELSEFTFVPAAGDSLMTSPEAIFEFA